MAKPQSAGITVNIYCDESGHVPLDRGTMVLGALSCPVDQVRAMIDSLRGICAKHHVPPAQEIKWSKVSPSKVVLYSDLIHEFFRHDDWCFRALVIPDKSKLDHLAHQQDADTWYYKMYYHLLKVVISPRYYFRIYVDIKDTKGGEKIRKLQEVLANSVYDFDQQYIERVQLVQSHEVMPLQLADLLIGVVQRANAQVERRAGAKDQLVEIVRKTTGYALTRSTLFREDKFNIFVWRPQESSTR